MIAYQLERNRRTQQVRIKIQPDGSVFVTAPRDCPLRFIDGFVQKHAEWIEQHRAEVVQQYAKLKKSEHEVLIFGKNYQKRVSFSNQQRIGVTVTANEFIINPVSETSASIEKTTLQFLKHTAEKYILPRTEQLAKRMTISYGSITLRNQKTRWGSCSSQGNLNFNWRLVHSPTEVIDYVIIHELAHRKHMNHSSKFWQLVAAYDPEYLKHRGWLKREGMVLG